MTRYEEDANRLAMQLAAMVIAPGAMAMTTDTDTVNLTRRGLWQWCRQVLNDLNPPDHQTRTGKKPRLSDLATDPVGALQTLLNRDPAPLLLGPQVGSSDVETANRRWARLGRDVELATHSWTTADPASRPKGEHAWLPVADVAAVAEAVALLDRHLADKHPGGPAGRVWRESAEIGLAAQCVLWMATDGPLPPPSPLDPPAGRLQPSPVPTLGQLPEALTNLGRLVTTASHIRPRTLAALLGQHIPVLETLAGALTLSPPPGYRKGVQRFAEAMRAHGHKLSNIRAAVKPLRSIEADDRRPTVQARAISTLVTRVSTPSRWSESDAQQIALTSLLPALAVTSAIGKAATASVQAGRWLEPSDSKELRWCKISSEHSVTEAVSVATAHSRELMAQLPPARPSRSPFRSPHEVLAPQLRSTDRTRPLSPTTPAPTL